jgi:predicted methyltransferase MtxX (methanogen marker protein 4)
MKGGEMHGHGKLYFIDETVYDGELHNGKIFGRGCRISKDGEMLER